ncbi:MAG TPA: HPr family phosphocarrier protein [Spongiibacteraceae bacterium]|jgi:phosphocarrier protein|nr:HPr family phosphocarrier protein [Spongiibacteraceae bacterium]HUH38494.1 HPr family phosphocarrier protein [Spongiibacteraceae bacterium]
MIEARLTIINKLGLHARAAAKLVTTTTAFNCTVSLGHGDRMVNGKSIMAVMMLAAGKGTELCWVFDGEDEQAAHDAVCALINNRFDEPE